jgi:methylmalonyl-CoA epimerase
MPRTEPYARRGAADSLLREVRYDRPSGLAAVLADLARPTVPAGSFVFLLSDFLGPVGREAWERALAGGLELVPGGPGLRLGRPLLVRHAPDVADAIELDGRRNREHAPKCMRRHATDSIEFVQALGIHHVGVAVEDLDDAVSTYERLFAAHVEHRETVVDQGVEAASLRVGNGRVELLAALGEDTPVGRFLASRGPGMHHVAYEVDDLPAMLRSLAGAGAELIDERPRRGMFGLEVAFVHPDAVHGVLSELIAVA